MIDLAFLKNFTKDDPTKMKRYISLYLDVAPKTFEEMQRNLETKDWEQMRIHAHSLKPQADFMGISELKDLLIRIEDAVKSDHVDQLNMLYISAKSAHDLSEIELRAVLDGLII